MKGMQWQGDEERVRVERPLPPEGQPPRITELWAWTSVDPMTDTEGIVAAKLPDRSIPLVTSTRSMAERMRPWAEAAARMAEEPRPTVRLRRFVPAEEAPCWCGMGDCPSEQDD